MLDFIVRIEEKFEIKVYRVNFVFCFCFFFIYIYIISPASCFLAPARNKVFGDHSNLLETFICNKKNFVLFHSKSTILVRRKRKRNKLSFYKPDGYSTPLELLTS